MIDLGMTADKLVRAKTHVHNICSQGSLVTLSKPASGAGSKDELGTVLTEETVSFNSYPIRYTPYERNLLNKISWAENTDILCFISKLDIDNSGYTVEKIRRFKTMKCGGKTYDLRYIELYSAFANDFLYMVIGGNK